MNILTGLSTILSYFTAFGGVTSIYEWLRYGRSEVIPIGIVLLVLSMFLSYPSNKRINADPIAFMFIIRGIVSLNTFFILQSPVFLIIPAILIVSGIIVLYLHSIISSLRKSRQRNNYKDLVSESVKYKKDESTINSVNKNREVESLDSVIFSEGEVFSTSRDTKSEESSELEKKNNIWKIMILLLTLVSYLMFFIVAISSINELIFPNYLGGDGIFDLLIYLLFGVIARYLTLLRYELRQRFIIILKNIFAFILMTSILGFLSLKGFTIFIISLILTIYLDIKSPNSKLEWLKSGPFLKSPKKVIFVIAGFLFIYYSLRMGVYNMGIENSLSQLKLASGNQDSNHSRVDNEVSVSESKNLSNISDPRETLRQMQEKHDRYMSDPEDAKQTIKGIQKGLYELGYYKGAIDGIYGPLTKTAIKNYRRDNYDPDTGHSIEEYVHDRVSLSLIEELGIPEP